MSPTWYSSVAHLEGVLDDFPDVSLAECFRRRKITHELRRIYGNLQRIEMVQFRFWGLCDGSLVDFR